MAEAEVDERLQVLRQTLGQRINTQNHDPVAVAEQYHRGQTAQPAQQFTGAEVADIFEKCAEWNHHGESGR